MPDVDLFPRCILGGLTCPPRNWRGAMADRAFPINNIRFSPPRRLRVPELVRAICRVQAVGSSPALIPSSAYLVPPILIDCALA